MYNNINLLRRIIEIQDITLEHKARGATQEWIYKNIIYPRYFISRPTYYRYLSINAKKMLKDKLL
jgi:hypothetical protein